MDVSNKATRIDLFSLRTRQMRAFHMTWFSFFLCFFAWFGIAPMMAIVRDELGLTKTQIGNTIIASVAITILARLFIGWLCDRIGPRLCYTWLLMLGSLPVMGIGLARSYESFLLFRLAIGAIGASFVITQYHTSVMFAPNCVGTANATSAGWGNLGGGVTQMVMPLIFAAFVGLGYTDYMSWRLAMVVAGGVCFVTGIAYFFVTTDLPEGNYAELRAAGKLRKAEKVKGTFAMACRDKRVWALFLIYAACFGVELTINNIAALYYKDKFGLSLKTAGLVAGLFGLMNIFARTMGGVIGDRFALTGGLKARVRWLFMALLIESAALMLFSQMSVLPIAIGTMIVFSLFVQMSEGATYSVVPFINKEALGSVSGIVGAGGNMGAVAAGFLFRAESLSYQQGLLILGCCVGVISFATFLVTFTPEDEEAVNKEFQDALKQRRQIAAERARKKAALVPAAGLLPAMARTVRPMDLLRVYLGLALLIKGVHFVMQQEPLEELAKQVGFFTTPLVWFVMTAHVIGGFCILLGLATRAAAAANIAVLAGAVVFIHLPEGLFTTQGLEFSMLTLFTLILVLWNGSGNASFDQYMSMSEGEGESTPEGAA